MAIRLNLSILLKFSCIDITINLLQFYLADLTHVACTLEWDVCIVPYSVTKCIGKESVYSWESGTSDMRDRSYSKRGGGGGLGKSYIWCLHFW